MKLSVIITAEDHQQFNRLDKLLSDKFPEISRSEIKKLFDQGAITAKDLRKVPLTGTEIIITLSDHEKIELAAEKIPLNILYEDEDLLFINKEAGLVVHPAAGNESGTLVNGLLHYFPSIRTVGAFDRPGIVHRIDKGTSGLLVVAKTKRAYEALVPLFAEHKIHRQYEALVMGVKYTPTGTLKGPIGRDPHNRLRMAINPNGKEAITHYQVIEFFDRFTHFSLTLETGRTHQIRVHLHDLLKTAILCDPLYGQPKEHLARLGGSYTSIIGSYEHPFLHAKKLGFIHPFTQKELLFEVATPTLFDKVIKHARGVI